jgi:hypothetical protein
MHLHVRAAVVEEVLQKGAEDFKPEIPAGLNKYSSRITQPKSQGASQAMLYGTGLTEADMNKPQVPIDVVLPTRLRGHAMRRVSRGVRRLPPTNERPLTAAPWLYLSPGDPAFRFYNLCAINDTQHKYNTWI